MNMVLLLFSIGHRRFSVHTLNSPTPISISMNRSKLYVGCLSAAKGQYTVYFHNEIIVGKSTNWLLLIVMAYDYIPAYFSTSECRAIKSRDNKLNNSSAWFVGVVVVVAVAITVYCSFCGKREFGKATHLDDNGNKRIE